MGVSRPEIGLFFKSLRVNAKLKRRADKRRLAKARRKANKLKNNQTDDKSN